MLTIRLARQFYGGVLGLKEGRRSESKWQDYSLFGHQIVCHYVGSDYRCIDHFNPVDGDEVCIVSLIINSFVSAKSLFYLIEL